MKSFRSIVAVLAACLALLLVARPLYAADTVATAREVVKKAAPSVVHITGTIKMSMGIKGMNMPAQEQKFDVIGTIIDPSGLTVVSNSSIDISEMFGGESGADEEGGKMEFKTEFSALKLRLSDGTEVPGKIVLKDQDLDLAFVMPDAASEEGKKMEGKYPALKLDDAAAVTALEEVIVVGRLGKNLDYQPVVGVGRIGAVVTKPRTFYVTSMDNMAAGLGVPVFNTEGKIVGIQVMRHSPGGEGSEMSIGSLAGAMIPVILPAADVAEIAKQAVTKKETAATRP